LFLFSSPSSINTSTDYFNEYEKEVKEIILKDFKEKPIIHLMFLIRKMANDLEKMKSFYIKAMETSTDSVGWNGEKVNGFSQL
tara:strand:- start:3115 stop:3363 length:249 start_codon:yes stop_codon:yes gene_type:complete